MSKTVSTITGLTILLLFCTASYVWLDKPLIDFFLNYKETAFHQTFKQITKLGESQWYLVGGLLLWLFYRKKDSLQAGGGLLLLTSVAVSGIAVNILKSILGRARPRLYIHEQIYGFDFFHIEYAWLSFPSGHSATALGAASALALIFPRYKTAFYTAGIIIAASRIVLAEHYLSDVIVGSFLGLATTLLLYQQHFRKTMHEQPLDNSLRGDILILGALCFISFFAGLGSVPLFDVDEGAFSEATREMLASGNYLTTYLYGEPRFDKPILTYWLQALSAKLFGLDEFALRLPSALASTGWTAALYFFSRRMFDRRTAFISTSLMMLSLQVTIIGKAAIADALLNCMLAVSMFAIFLYYRKRRTAYILLAFTAIGLGTLTKGPVAILIPLAVSFIFFFLQHELRVWIRAVLNPGGIALFTLIVLPWYTLEYLDQGMAFIEGFFLKHNIGRLSAPLEKHGGSLWYYIPVLLLGISPSTVLLFPVLRKIRALTANPLNTYLLTWFGFVFIFFSLSGTKLPHYVIYGYTPLFILMAQALPGFRREYLITLWPAGVLFLLAAAPVVIHRISKGVSDPYIIAVLESAIVLMESSGHTVILSLAAAAIIGISFIPGLSILERLIASGTIFCMIINFHIMPLAGKIMQEPVKEAALITKAQGYKVVMWKINNPSFLVYSETLTERRKPEPGEIVLTSVKYLKRLPDPIIMYEKNGIVLAKLREPASQAGTQKAQ